MDSRPECFLAHPSVLDLPAFTAAYPTDIHSVFWLLSNSSRLGQLCFLIYIFLSALRFVLAGTISDMTMRFLHTMLRVGNLQRSIDFYTNVIGMQLLRTSENPEYKYSLAFLGFEGGNPDQAEIELTYNWGVESYEMGTAYGHIALGVPDAYAACEKIKAAGGNVTREAGPVKGGTTVIAFVTDPDGYKIELIERKDDHGTGTGLR